MYGNLLKGGAPMEKISADLLMKELLAEAMLSGGNAFTIEKTLGTVESRRDENGNLLPDTDTAARTDVEINAAAVRLLAERVPSLKISYPGKVLAEQTVCTGDVTVYSTLTRTDALIEVPEDFVQVHCGISFQKLMQEGWSEQLGDLTAQIAERLKKHEMRTNRLFGKEDAASAAVSFRITSETAESDIWCIPLHKCGLYPLQWDGEVCGMALLLIERLKEALNGITDVLEIAAKRDEKQKLCTVTVYYSIKQD